MNQEEVRQILQGWRPGEEPSAQMKKAFAALENDPALADWFEEQQAVDDRMRRAVRSLQPPEGLKNSVLQLSKVTALPEPRRARVGPWLLAAAAGVAMAVGVSLFFATTGGRLETARLEEKIPQLTVAHEHVFHSPEASVDAMRKWLAEKGAPSQFLIPSGLASAKGASCEVVSMGRAKISLLCFNLGNGRVVHLYVVDRDRLANAPAEAKPAFQQMGDVAVASWSQGDKSYFLAERGNADSVRQLL